MMAELILTSLLISNQPAFVGASGAPYLQHEVRGRIVKELPLNLFLKLEPYVWISDGMRANRGGAEVEIGLNVPWTPLSVSFYHHSSHSFDYRIPTVSRGIEMDGIRVVWKLR